MTVFHLLHLLLSVPLHILMVMTQEKHPPLAEMKIRLNCLKVKEDFSKNHPCLCVACNCFIVILFIVFTSIWIFCSIDFRHLIVFAVVIVFFAKLSAQVKIVYKRIQMFYCVQLSGEWGGLRILNPVLTRKSSDDLMTCASHLLCLHSVCLTPESDFERMFDRASSRY